MTPEVRVVRGEPDDVELAALVAGLAAGSAAGAAVGATADLDLERYRAAARRRWREAAQGLGDRLAPGPDAWRWSALR